MVNQAELVMTLFLCTQAQVEQSKKEWELAHLMALKEEEERRMEEADEIFYTREDNQVNIFVTSSSSSDEDNSDEGVVVARKSSKSKRKRPLKAAPRKMVRGRGRGSRGPSRADMKRKRPPSSSEEERSSESVYVDDERSREGDPLGREYEQEIAAMESDDLYTEDDDRWMYKYMDVEERYSDEEVDFPDREVSPPYRESPLWKVAEQSERLLHEIPPAPHVDYGPNEIMSFSKSGRPRKRNKRLYEDEFEVFSPVSSLNEPARSKPQIPSRKPLYNIVIETTKKKSPVLKKQSAKAIISAPVNPPTPVLHQVAPQSRILMPLSFVSTGTPAGSLASAQSQPAVLVPQRSSTQPVQWQTQAPGSRPILLSSKSPQTKAVPPAAAVKTRDNLFELDFTLDNSYTAPSSLAQSNAGDDLITLNLEPVALPEESFFEPSNEEERNVFESFASLLQ